MRAVSIAASPDAVRPVEADLVDADLTEHATVHEIHVDASADTVYRLVATVADWPQIFPPTVHVERSGDDRVETLRMWAFAHGAVRSWTSRRWLDPHARSVTFRQVRSTHPVASMTGMWKVRATSPTSAMVLLYHWFHAVDDDPGAVALIENACDTNSRSELAALKTAAEQAESPDDLVLDFEDEIAIDADPQAVFSFLERGERWADLLPHVARSELTETEPGVQYLEMDTVATDGSTHTTESVRVCLDGNRIVYKQTRTPQVMSAHLGRWTVRPDGAGGTVAVSRHVVVIRPDQIAQLLGPNGTVATCRDLIRTSLGANSLTTLRHAKAVTEASAVPAP